jgi:hypothetical protein
MISKFESMRKIACLLFLAPLAFIACDVVPVSPETGESMKLYTIYASAENDSELKSVIDNTTFETEWLAGDAINVFFGATQSSRFVTTESAPVAQFKGSIAVVTGGGEGLDDDTSLWGVYPYNSANTCDGTTVTLSLPSNQAPAANTFANGLFPQIARTKSFYMTFYNLCGCIRFTVSSPDVKAVVLAGNNNEQIAGKARVSLDKVPQVEEILNPQVKLTMRAPGGGCFEPGVNYYFVLFPTTFSNGLSMTYYKEDTYATYVYSDAYTLARNKVSRFKDRDAGLTFTHNPLVDWEEGDKIEDEI